ncbi:substrate-binding domain-containing protein [Parvularcula oceani]|uniref:substrate-binding domain-containing protein n=1 Tax=Parvularcula oceani TaxID=1247963 RepID=UPI0006915673|nr:substrate-binding domain-containing protein [Parvularcula oceani]
MTALLLALLAFLDPVQASEPQDGPLTVTGSSTVAPYALAVAAQAPAGDVLVEQSGTAAGIAALCRAEGAAADLAGASRPIREAELAACHAAGVATIVEVELGLDGIVLAQAETASDLRLSPRDLFLAIARSVPAGGESCRLVSNRTMRWQDVRPDLPDRPILIYGPPTSSGTRDMIIELAVKEGARSLPCMAQLEDREPEAFEAAVDPRTDGPWIDAGESDGAIAYTLTRTPDAIGIFGMDHAKKQEGLVTLSFGGVHPTPSTISTGRYRLTRPLFLYTTARTLTQDERTVRFVKAFRKEASGDEGHTSLARMGLVPREEAGARFIETATGEATPVALGN